MNGRVAGWPTRCIVASRPCRLHHQRCHAGGVSNIRGQPFDVGQEPDQKSSVARVGGRCKTARQHQNANDRQDPHVGRRRFLGKKATVKPSGRLKAAVVVASVLQHTVALRIAYDGSRFDAYARNPKIRTVEGCLIGALRHEGYVEDSFKAGSRTDAGVSALENVCRATIERDHLRGLVPALQRELPAGLWVTAAASVPAGWNPRHAHTRTYRYVAVPRGEDFAAMAEACKAFLGRHHMGAFAKMEEGRNPERTIRGFTVEPHQDLWLFRTISDGYLWNQVRRMVGAVLAVGQGEATAADIATSLQSGIPHKRFKPAPAQGLLLESVQYDNLEWSQEAGRLGPHRVPGVLREATVQLDLAKHLLSLAPWPADGNQTESG
jgi:tRNA pseudouridine38-40 synthase